VKALCYHERNLTYKCRGKLDKVFHIQNNYLLCIKTNVVILYCLVVGVRNTIYFKFNISVHPIVLVDKSASFNVLVKFALIFVVSVR
jgi:hypothetical protein